MVGELEKVDGCIAVDKPSEGSFYVIPPPPSDIFCPVSCKLGFRGKCFNKCRDGHRFVNGRNFRKQTKFFVNESFREMKQLSFLKTERFKLVLTILMIHEQFLNHSFERTCKTNSF